MNLAPIVLFVYNRLDCLKKTIDHLQKNELAYDSELFIYSDGPKDSISIQKVKDVRSYISCITGFKKVTVIERGKNMGARDSVIGGVTEVINKFGRVIVVEDDLITSRYFLRYMNEALTTYQSNDEVGSICGYVYPISGLSDYFFIRSFSPWGWATWKRSWDLFERDSQLLLLRFIGEKYSDEISSYYKRLLKMEIRGVVSCWDIKWHFSLFCNDKLILYPGKTYVNNIGFGKDATHTNSFIDVPSMYNSKLQDEYSFYEIEVRMDSKAEKKHKFYIDNYKYIGLFHKIKMILSGTFVRIKSLIKVFFVRFMKV
ncbi:glycosyltransferase [Ichthyobacterium seriolicida]|uniref:Sugar transferase n=1 Tax=Ichthyobacterium seriolicida TaxID=242600 RepID=A0A1J1EA48_9FLAO|nr:glycosyltransferase [Ichthyobacterium seriolicida]BAV94803.1 sugar transferase [Ichthyobacterium seriolicida]